MALCEVRVFGNGELIVALIKFPTILRLNEFVQHKDISCK